MDDKEILIVKICQKLKEASAEQLRLLWMLAGEIIRK